MDQPPLQFLHTEDRLIRLKLEYLEKLTTEQIIDSLSPGREGALKTRPDGTVIDGHSKTGFRYQSTASRCHNV